jgi:Ca2+-binding RTX toxin-like protein
MQFASFFNSAGVRDSPYVTQFLSVFAERRGYLHAPSVCAVSTFPETTMRPSHWLQRLFPPRHDRRPHRLTPNLQVERLESRYLPATIQGIVFEDTNGNGVQDGGEMPVPGVVVFATSDLFSDSLIRPDQARFESAPSTNFGVYSITVPTVGDYFVGVIPTNGRQATITRTPVFQQTETPFQLGATSDNLKAVTSLVEKDGHVDLIAAIGNNLSLLKNDGHGNFTASTITLPGVGVAGNVVAGDFDGDGDQDLAVADADPAQKKVYLFRNDNGVLTSVPVCVPSSGAFSLNVGNLDGDIGDELVVTHQDGISIFLDPLAGGSPTSTINLGGTIEDAVIGNFVGDSFNDIAFTNSSNGQVGLLRGLGNSGAFQTSTTFPIPKSFESNTVYPRSIAAGDLTGDGVSEFVVTLMELGPEAGDGEQSFGYAIVNSVLTEATSFSSGPGPNTVELKDLDGDHDLDIVLQHGTKQDANKTVNLSLYRNDGNLSFENLLFAGVNFTDVNNHIRGFAVADLDGDGQTDIAYVESGTGRHVELLLNAPVQRISVPTSNVSGLNFGVTRPANTPPVFTSASSVNVAENTTAVLTVMATDTPPQTVTFSLPLIGGADQSKFAITNGGMLTFKSAPNRESPTDVGADNVYNVTVTATDSLGLSSNQNLVVTVMDMNEFPPVLNDATFSIAENSLNGTSVGTMAATDEDATKSFRYTITAGNSLGIFEINAETGTISVANNVNLDREQISSIVLTVQVSDDGPGTARTDTASVRINVTGVNDNSPVFRSSNSVSVVETHTLVTTIAATDADQPDQTVTFSITGGADQARFGLVGGVLSFLTAPNFATPTDVDGNNIYEVIVTANDGNGGTTPQTIAVRVTGIPILERLVVRLNSATSVTIERTDDGNTTTQTLTGSQPIVLDDLAAVIDFELPSTNDSGVVFADVTGADGLMRFTGTNLRTVTFNITRATTLIVHGNDGNDSIKVSSLDAAFVAAIELYGDAGKDTLDTTALSVATKLIGGLGDDALKGGTGNDTLIGGAGNDALTGGGGSDLVMESLAGVVTLSGTALKATAGNDTLSGIEQVSLTGGDAPDKFDATAAPSTMSVSLFGNGGSDTLIGGAGSDSLNGGNDADVITGGLGNDVLVGGDGVSTGTNNDVLTETASGTINLTASGISGALGTDSYSGFEGASLTGGSGSDSLDASSAIIPVTLTGGAGSDMLKGGSGDDVLFGGAGIDMLNGGGGTDTVFENANLSYTLSASLLVGNGNDALTSIEKVSILIPSVRAATANTFRISESVDGFTAGITFDGGLGTDIVVASGAYSSLTLTNLSLTGVGSTVTLQNIEQAKLTTTSSGDNTIDASLSSLPTTLMGGAGNDTLLGGAMADSINGGSGGMDSIVGGAGNDTLDGGAGGTTLGIAPLIANRDDIIRGGDGDDSIKGQGGNDYLFGDLGFDTIDGGDGHDVIDTGDAALTAGAGTNSKRDSVIGGVGNDAIRGGNGNDLLNGGGDNDTILGGAGNDALIGELGDDLLRGENGSDNFNGGAGTDTYDRVTNHVTGTDTPSNAPIGDIFAVFTFNFDDLLIGLL